MGWGDLVVSQRGKRMLPEEFLLRMQEKLGEDFPKFLASYDQPRHQALRLNQLKKTESGESMEKALTALFHMEKVPWAKSGYYYVAIYLS